MNTYILSLDDPQADLERVGGKGMSLAKLCRAGLPTPGGFHITTQAYREFVAANDLQIAIEAALQVIDPTRPASLETASQAIIENFLRAEIPAELAHAIVQAYVALPGSDPAVAVRSSATAEDLPEASFAGQQDTYLNIAGADQVLLAVKKCWASLWTGRAIGYRSRQEIGAQGVALAVVVQLLVDAQAAGILFTANPLNGDRQEMVINAAWGLGEAVVGGRVSPDIVTVSKVQRRVLHRETAEKLIMTVRTESGVHETPTPETLRKAPVLSDAQAVTLADFGAQIERLYNTPMDIEWALVDGKYAILQARPITALPEAPIEWKLPNPKGVYMRASAADLMPKPLSPLFVTTWIPAQREQMKPVGKRMTGVEPVLADDYFTSINNYAYMNAAMTPRAMWWAFTGLLPAYPRLLRRLARLWRDELHPEYRQFVEMKKGRSPSEMTPRELWDETLELTNAAAYYVCGLMFATMGASSGSEALFTKVYNQFARQDGDPDAATLLMGWDTIAARSEKSLYDIAMWIKGDAELAKYITETPATELAGQLSGCLEPPLKIEAGLWQEFTGRWQAHMANFGHIIFQLDFAEPLPLDHPEMLLESTKMYLRGSGANPHERQQASEERRERTAEAMRRRLRGLKRWAFEKALNWGQSMAQVREDALAEIGLAYPRLRQLLGELGRRLAAGGAIQHAEDIYWLENEEVRRSVARLEGRQALENLAEKVEERQAFNARMGQVVAPPMMPQKERIWGVKTDIYVAKSEADQVGNVLKGVATSAGRVTAPACVLHGPEDFAQMQPGDVLVAGATTPAWTPLFAMASAVVTDIGGPLSHGSIVAREFGIPAVMGVGVATRRIHNGQIITVDGSAGTVTLL